MSQLNLYPIGSKAIGQVAKINSVKSAKMGLYSAIVSFMDVTETALGKSYANRGFFGIMLTEKDPATLLKVGDRVSVNVVSYRESEYNGQTLTAAQVTFNEKIAERVQMAQAEAAATK
ncbi:MAG: hypothetical protein EBW87_02110 [Burkholderiaceae bacterium]|nr:hypothetical protein [Burkholderiaceae bacterium]